MNDEALQAFLDLPEAQNGPGLNVGNAGRTQTWIVVRNWRRFQHYKDRQPTWIKIYVELLEDPHYRSLPMFHRGLLHDIWLLYATSRGQVPASPAYLARRLSLVSESEYRARRLSGDSVATRWRLSGDSMATLDTEGGDRPVRTRDLKRLEQAGFITITTSKPLAITPESASPEKELRKSKKESKKKEPGASRTTTKTTVCEHCEVGAGRHTDDCPTITKQPVEPTPTSKPVPTPQERHQLAQQLRTHFTNI